MSMRLLKATRDLERGMGTVFKNLNFFSVNIKQTFLSKDLKYATFSIASIDEEHIKSDDLLVLMTKKTSLIKRELRKYINFKYFPNIRFVLDSHKERVENIFKLLDQVREKEGLDVEEEDDSHLSDV